MFTVKTGICKYLCWVTETETNAFVMLTKSGHGEIKDWVIQSKVKGVLAYLVSCRQVIVSPIYPAKKQTLNAPQ